MTDRRNISNKQSKPTPYISKLKLNCVVDFAKHVTGGDLETASILIVHYWKIGYLERGFRGQQLCDFASEMSYREFHGIDE